MAPAVSSASGTPPGRSVQAQPPGAASVYGCANRNCWPRSQSMIGDCQSGMAEGETPSEAGGDACPTTPGRQESALTESVVTQVARFESIAQLPSPRWDLVRN